MAHHAHASAEYYLGPDPFSQALPTPEISPQDDQIPASVPSNHPGTYTLDNNPLVHHYDEHHHPDVYSRKFYHHQDAYNEPPPSVSFSFDPASSLQHHGQHQDHYNVPPSHYGGYNVQPPLGSDSGGQQQSGYVSLPPGGFSPIASTASV